MIAVGDGKPAGTSIAGAGICHPRAPWRGEHRRRPGERARREGVCRAPRGGPCRRCPGGQKAAAKKKVATKPAKLPSAPAKYLPNIVSTSASLIVPGARATPAFSSLGQSRWGPGHRAVRHVTSSLATARRPRPLGSVSCAAGSLWSMGWCSGAAAGAVRRRAMASGSETTCARPPPPLRPSPHPRPSVPTLAPASRPKSVRKFHRMRPPRRLARPLRTHPRARIPALNFLSAAAGR